MQDGLAERVSERRGPPRKRRSDRGGDTTELGAVMGEIAELMGSVGGLLTMYAESHSPVLLYVDSALGDERVGWMIAACREMRPTFEDGKAFWRSVPQRAGRAVMLLPIERAPGHSRLVISLLFEELNDAIRREAERVYRERRPFAVGYFQLWQQNRALERRVVALETALDQSGIGVVLVDRLMRIAFANDVAETILTASDGLGQVDGILRPSRLADAVDLQAALAFAITGHSEPEQRYAPLLALRRKSGPALIAAIAAVRAATGEMGDIAAAIYLIDPRVDPTRTLVPLCRLHGLSPVETDLVCYLAGGETLASAARKMRIKELTARGYLKQVFAKTGTNRQSDLIILMLSSMPRMKADILIDVVADRLRSGRPRIGTALATPNGDTPLMIAASPSPAVSGGTVGGELQRQSSHSMLTSGLQPVDRS